MKIGVLTFNNTTNYGAILQCFALQTRIKELGSRCEVINYHCKSIENREGILFPSISFDLKSLEMFKRYIKLHRKREVIERFKNDYIEISDKEYDKNKIINDTYDYDLIIAGSDMIWELGITNYDFSYYLDFLENEKKYSYAASIGIEHYDKDKLSIIKEKLRGFKSISVRELQAKRLIESLGYDNVRVDLDPVFLLDANKWRDIYKKGKKIKGKCILVYFPDQNGIMLNTAKSLAKRVNCQVYIIHDSFRTPAGCVSIRSPKVEEFLYLIDNAYLVITGSYHGMLFSILFRTFFFYFDRANSSRMESIASILNCEDRRLTKDHIPNIELDFTEITEKLNKEIIKSESYLKQIISGV